MATFTLPGIPVQRITFTATYSVNADGRVSETTTDSLGEVNHFDLYPTLDGSTIASISTDRGQFRFAVLARSSGKALLNP